jgi:hypothetical protein
VEALQEKAVDEQAGKQRPVPQYELPQKADGTSLY